MCDVQVLKKKKKKRDVSIVVSVWVVERKDKITQITI